MTTARDERRSRRQRRPRVAVWLAGVAVAVLLFVAGVAVGEALHDNPRPGITQTVVRTLHP